MDLKRTNIGIIGRMNSGKSSLMNLLTQAQSSLVDETPGTTADTKTCLMELHGLGPVCLYDTAGVDEAGTLGEKKREKVLAVMKEADLLLLVLNPAQTEFVAEQKLIEEARALDKQLLIIRNVFTEDRDLSQCLPLSRLHPVHLLRANDVSCRQGLIDFILVHYECDSYEAPLLPFLKKDEFYVLNIPMDVETPQGRLLKPQALVEEFITRNWAFPVCYRMDLTKARGSESENEKQRFIHFLEGFKKRPQAIITDSQALDVMIKWAPQESALTTFSIVMINATSRGRLSLFVEGLKALSTLKKGDRVLIAEACNHSRIGEDIGTVQIPRALQKHFPGVEIVHSFGKEVIEGEFQLAIHCGGCMITPQKMSARIRDLISLKIPTTNYGLFLSYLQGPEALRKVLEPWGL